MYNLEQLILWNKDNFLNSRRNKIDLRRNVSWFHSSFKILHEFDLRSADYAFIFYSDEDREKSAYLNNAFIIFLYVFLIKEIKTRCCWLRKLIIKTQSLTFYFLRFNLIRETSGTHMKVS